MRYLTTRRLLNNLPEVTAKPAGHLLNRIVHRRSFGEHMIRFAEETIGWPSLRLTVCGLLMLVYANDSSAQTGGRDSNASMFDVAVSDLQTTGTVSNIQSVRSECSRYAPVYRPDCLRQGLELIWRQLPFHGDYQPMRSALSQASKDIGRIVTANVDSNTPRLDSGLNANPRFKARRRYTAVAQTNIGQTAAEIDKRIETLDSGLHVGTDAIDAHYRRVAGAIGSFRGVVGP